MREQRPPEHRQPEQPPRDPPPRAREGSAPHPPPADGAELLPAALRAPALVRWWTLALLAVAVNALLAARALRAAGATARPPAHATRLLLAHPAR